MLQWHMPNNNNNKQLICPDNNTGFHLNINNFLHNMPLLFFLLILLPNITPFKTNNILNKCILILIFSLHPLFPPHMPPHMGPTSFAGGPYDSAPPPAPPPPYPELRKRINKLVEYVVKNGPGFEAMVCEKEHKNPEYGFLFGGEGNAYYRYKLYLFTRSPAPFGAPFPPMPGMHPPPMNPNAASGPMMVPPQMHQPPFPRYDQPPSYSQPYMGDGYDQQSKPFRAPSGPLPSDVAMELSNLIANLTGTKESIKGAKAWFMQRAPFASALAEALRDRVFALHDSEKQLHILYLANDILFDR